MNATAPKLTPALPERETTSFAIDSRDVKAGDVFFALSQPDYANNGFNGDFDDATPFVPSAFEKGAVACVVRRDRFDEHQPGLAEFEDRLIFTDDAIKALQDLAHGVYLEWNKPVVAVTGSAGKTTAKELTAHVLQSSGRKVLRNIKNYNNGLGHPLTVLNLAADPGYDVAVLEMGMSTPMNEIQRLCRITPPDVAVELNVLPVHVEHLGSIENVAKAKAELVEGMKQGGTAVLNADDERVAAMRALSRGETITYGITSPAEVSASQIAFADFGNTRFVLTTPEGTAEVEFPLNGRHNIMNALAAAAVGHVFGMSSAKIAASLGGVQPPPQRGEVLRFAKGFTVINDSYNSNPTALISMVQTLVDGGSSAKRKILVAGEMLELGDGAHAIHRQTGETIASMGIDMLIGVRGLAEDLVRGAETVGKQDLSVRFAVDSDEAAEIVAGEIMEGDLVLVKGSRGVRTEKVIERLVKDFDLEEKAI
ncbi:MAG TPA: UDP-N-acetylmuramoyl-tripeptide--D-alanyl-D-alanine ligase [Pyrinomonadaceae bacterium]|nr:UDP-N-acetylmuramoyl-tripeptide--D-alanyl-D-alanine ligase [Pyrinomonadaceae bacterium]